MEKHADRFGILVVCLTSNYADFFKKTVRDWKEVTIYWAFSFEEALQTYRLQQPKLAISPLLYPGHDGMELMLEMRKSDPTLFFMIYAETEDDYTEVAALDTGVDDFVHDHLSPKVMRRKLENIIHRLKRERGNNSIEVGELSIDRDRYLVHRGDELIALPRKEFEMLYLLASHPEKVFKREELTRIIWGNIENIKSRTIDVHVRKLRQKLGPGYIRTVKGVGYRF